MSGNGTADPQPHRSAAGPDLLDHQFYLARHGHEFGPYTLQTLQAMAISGQLRASGKLRRATGYGWFPARDVPWLFSDRQWVVALILSASLGVFGADRFYLGHTALGVAKLLTIGGLGLWALVDVILIAFHQVRDARGRPLR
jgi:hypothetical protein